MSQTITKIIADNMKVKVTLYGSGKVGAEVSAGDREGEQIRKKLSTLVPITKEAMKEIKELGKINESE